MDDEQIKEKRLWENETLEETKARDRNRDHYFRCPLCMNLFHHRECERNEDTGAYLCPNLCIAPFIQDPYDNSSPD